MKYNNTIIKIRNKIEILWVSRTELIFPETLQQPYQIRYYYDSLFFFFFFFTVEKIEAYSGYWSHTELEPRHPDSGGCPSCHNTKKRQHDRELGMLEHMAETERVWIVLVPRVNTAPFSVVTGTEHSSCRRLPLMKSSAGSGHFVSL